MDAVSTPNLESFARCLTSTAAKPQQHAIARESNSPESISLQALLAWAFERAHLQRALKHVRQNRDALSIDDMTVDEFPEYLRHHWLEIHAKLEAGRYRPQPVRRVEVSKPEGKTRSLGIYVF